VQDLLQEKIVLLQVKDLVLQLLKVEMMWGQVQGQVLVQEAQKDMIQLQQDQALEEDLLQLEAVQLLVMAQGQALAQPQEKMQLPQQEGQVQEVLPRAAPVDAHMIQTKANV
jgi:hypothetical protein